MEVSALGPMLVLLSLGISLCLLSYILKSKDSCNCLYGLCCASVVSQGLGLLIHWGC